MSKVHRIDAQIAITGAGFAGSLLAMICRRLGYDVVLVERGRHPRFVIGESSTPLANLMLEELAQRYGLERVGSLSKWGSWQRDHPQIGCGLKRGFTFYHHDWDGDRLVPGDRTRQLLVAASPHDGIADTHWYRPDFDWFLAGEAQRMGAAYMDRTELASLEEGCEGLRLSGRKLDDGKRVEIRCRFLVDGSGIRGFVWRRLGLEDRGFREFPRTQGVYAHFRGVAPIDKQVHGGEAPPYPVDDAAVHHLFPGGWIWVLRFNNGLVSAGAAVRENLARRLGLAQGELGWRRLLEHLPEVRRQFEGAAVAHPFVGGGRLSFCASEVIGRRWALLPSAAGFVDPLLSTGFPLTLSGVWRLAEMLERSSGKGLTDGEQLSAYGEATRRELGIAAGLVGTLYACLGRPRLFNATALVYFALASYAETMRRLGKASGAPRFLMPRDAGFARRWSRLNGHARALARADQAGAEGSFEAEIVELIRPYNVAGLGDPMRKNWYGVRAEDMLEAAPKLEASEREIRMMLERSGFWG